MMRVSKIYDNGDIDENNYGNNNNIQEIHSISQMHKVLQLRCYTCYTFKSLQHIYIKA